MADSVALLRRKIQDTSLAVQDGTLNSVITLAAIEVRCLPHRLPNLSLMSFGFQKFGKGNITVAGTHVNGVKRMVNMRGGINAVRQTSPLTARMVSW